MKFFWLIVIVLVIYLTPIKIYADISLLLHEATGYSGEMTGAGHITIYVSDVCTDSPLMVRQCLIGEPKGVVLSTYPDFLRNPTNEHQWYAMPVLPYLTGVDDEQAIPLYANGKIRRLLIETNHTKYLSKIIPSLNDESSSTGRWSEVIGVTLSRDIYAFTVKTTPEQTIRFLNQYGVAPKGNNFNILTNNCADFTRDILNFYFPHSASRDLINDFGITTPKALVRTFSKYASSRPEMLYHITKYPQIDGPILRSFSNRNFTQTIFTSKKYVIIQALTMPALLPIFAGTYFLTGYFNVDSDYRKNPSMEMAYLNLEKSRQDNKNKEVSGAIKLRQTAEEQRIFGEKRNWEAYRLAFYPLVEKAINDRLFADWQEVKSFFGDLEFQGEPFYDSSGELMLKVNNYGQQKTLGVTRHNILGPQSDIRLAYKLMLVKIKTELEAAGKNRENLEVMQANWELLMTLFWRSANLPPVELPANVRFKTNPERKSAKKKKVELFREITH